MKITRRFVLGAGGVGLAAAALPILAGCDHRASPKSSGGRPLRLQSSWVNDAEFIGYFVAMANGYYKEAGLDFDYASGSPDIVAGEKLASKQCDVALTNIDGTVSAILTQRAPFKIIGTQYQKSPLGIVSLEESGIREPKDLINRKLAVPDANLPTIKAFLRMNNVDPRQVRLMPYQYDPAILVQGQVDATVDFVTNVPYAIRLQNKKPKSFLLADFGFKQFMDTVVVRQETLAKKSDELIAFLRASRQGWEENFKNVNLYPDKLAKMMTEVTGRTIDNEKYFNLEQKPLMESPSGIFSMTEAGIEENIASLRAVGLRATRDMFVTDLLAKV